MNVQQMTVHGMTVHGKTVQGMTVQAQLDTSTTTEMPTGQAYPQWVL